MSDVARQYGLNRSTVGTILAKKDIIKKTQRAEGVTKIISEKQRCSIHEKMERLLLIWIKEKEMKKDVTSMTIIQKKAREIFEELKKQTSHSSHEEIEFKVTTGWFSKIRRRTGIKHMVIHGESASADKEEAEQFCLRFEEFIKKDGYCPQQICLFWKYMPNHTYVMKEEKNIPRHKPMKDQLTLLLGANASAIWLIQKAWSEVTQQQLNSAWQKLSPSCIQGERDDVPKIMYEIVTTVRVLELEVNKDDIEELIMESETDLTTEQLQECLNEEHQETQQDMFFSEKEKDQKGSMPTSAIKELLKNGQARRKRACKACTARGRNVQGGGKSSDQSCNIQSHCHNTHPTYSIRNVFAWRKNPTGVQLLYSYLYYSINSASIGIYQN
ncbi:uncharacterized protein LOC111620491 [Centruroides sculpturatus]|uniref:uncharacterized protein LOC111620491 n=1 Tax=Centruroides sculpturatus TaxID=218467 RepID=UPI000C6D7421|nr:uncharacterized protein LOC111620491 [Centruroides sculpturatus]